MRPSERWSVVGLTVLVLAGASPWLRAEGPVLLRWKLAPGGQLRGRWSVVSTPAPADASPLDFDQLLATRRPTGDLLRRARAVARAPQGGSYDLLLAGGAGGSFVAEYRMGGVTVRSSFDSAGRPASTTAPPVLALGHWFALPMEPVAAGSAWEPPVRLLPGPVEGCVEVERTQVSAARLEGGRSLS